jgi:alpha-beta hydrolase superfamily lysophospholipase
VVLVAGMGPLDRDSTVGPNKPFRDLAEQLIARGVAVLRYDKITYGHPESQGSLTAEEEVVADAVEMVGRLQRHPAVRREAIFVVGHSLGAWLAPEIAARAAPVSGLVLLAPPARPIITLMLEQLRYLAANGGQTALLEAQAARILAQEADPSERFVGMPVRYLMDLMRRNPIGLARSLALPTLLLRGERDYQVSAVDLELWKDGLAGVPGVKAVPLPGLNHLLIHGEGRPGPAESRRPGVLHPSVGRHIAEFIAGATRVLA